MDKKQTEKIFKNVVEIPKESFDSIRDFVFNENYNWCMINLGSKRMYKGFDEIVLVNSNSDNEIEKINNIYEIVYLFTLTEEIVIDAKYF